MKLQVKDLFEENEFFRMLKLRYEIGDQTIFLTTGNTNSGKTVFNVLLYYLIKKGILKEKIDLKKCRMYFSIVDFAKEITKLKDEIIFYDEAGAELDIGEWNNIFNKIMRHILQTQRIQRNFYFILLPHIRYISYVLLPLFTFHIITERKVIPKKNGYEIERIATINKIFAQQQFSEMRNYYDIRLVAQLRIPDITKIRNKDFRELYQRFHQIEIRKKKEIARKIEEEAKMYLLKEKTKLMKIKRTYDQEKQKLKDVK